jgi:glucose-1-phosphate thymidylyltransferase/glucose-1-phosphate adenylyltransferase
MSRKLLILAGGASSRMKKSLADGLYLNEDLIKQAEVLPKAMLGVGKNGRPFLDYLLYNALRAQCEEVILLLNPKDNFTQDYYENPQNLAKFGDLKIKFARQYIPSDREKPLGTADAVLQTLQQNPDWQRERFIVCNSDNLYSIESMNLLWDCPYPNALPDYDTKGMDEAQVRNCAILQTDEEGFLVNLIEKPDDNQWFTIIQHQSRIGSSWNIFVFYAPDILPILERVPLSPERNEKELPTAVRMLIEEKPKSVFTIPLQEKIPDLTSKADISIVQAYLEKEFGDF